MARQFYRVDVTSDLGWRLRRLWNECTKAERAAEVFAKKVGAETYYPSDASFAGGVECVSFADTAKVNKKLWRSIGKDADGYEQWQPIASCRYDIMVLPRRNFMPSDTATRIYDKHILSWDKAVGLKTLEEWAKVAGVEMTDNKKEVAIKVDNILRDSYFIRYIELYRDEDEDTPKDRRTKVPYYIRESIRIERARILLPVVKTERIYQLLKADQSVAMKDGKPTIVRDTAPTFFEYSRHIYIGCDYPCYAEGLQSISSVSYVSAKENLLKMQRDKEALEN